MPIEIKSVNVDELYKTIIDFVNEGQHIIGDYDDMKELILKMIRAGYAFNMDRDRLRDSMEDITYMLCPEDDANKDRVVKGLEYETDDYSDDDDDDNEIPPHHEEGLTIEEISDVDS